MSEYEQNPDSPLPFEFRVVGPPGCGKTTWLAEEVNQAAADGKHVLVTSLTRAAAAEINEKEILYPDQLGTLHSHAFRALGNPKLAHTKTSIDAWNADNPNFKLSESQNNSGESIDKDNMGPVNDGGANALLTSYQWHRARRVPLQHMPDQVQRFAGHWEKFKRDNDTLDYTDLIERAGRDTDSAPGQPDIIFADESQDFDFLEMALLRRWGAAASSLITVGDPDQNLYTFRGSDPRAFTHPTLPESQWRTLNQSYRIPKAVHRHAIGWINKQADRSKVNYYPRDAIGAVLHSEATWRTPAVMIQEIKDYITEGKSIMAIASASYLIDPLIDSLRFEAIPFHNPQRRSNGRWNPIPTRSNATNAASRLSAFLKLSETGSWSADQLRLWTQVIKTTDTTKIRNAKTYIEALENNDTDFDGHPTLTVDSIMEIFTDEAMDAAYAGDIDWYHEHLNAQAKKSAAFPVEVARTWGADALTKEPNLVVGTCHSVKGGEADVVFLFPDLSRLGLGEWRNGEGDNAASVYRLFYVGMTRTRETLVICNPGDANAPSI